MTNAFHTQRIFIIRVMELQSEIIFGGEGKSLYTKKREKQINFTVGLFWLIYIRNANEKTDKKNYSTSYASH